MSKSKAYGKDKKKSAQLVLRVEKAERDAFVELCETMDTTAAREIRRFMRDFVARNTPAAAEVAEPAVAEPAVAEVPAEPAKRARKAKPEVVEAVAEPAAAEPMPKRRKKAPEPA